MSTNKKQKQKKVYSCFVDNSVHLFFRESTECLGDLKSSHAISLHVYKSTFQMCNYCTDFTYICSEIHADSPHLKIFKESLN